MCTVWPGRSSVSVWPLNISGQRSETRNDAFFVVAAAADLFDFEETEYRVTLSGRVVLEYQWVCTKDAIELVPPPFSLEWNRSWKNKLLEVMREGEEGEDIMGLIRMCWNGIMWKYKRLEK